MLSDTQDLSQPNDRNSYPVVNTTEKNIEEMFKNDMNENHKALIGAKNGVLDQSLVYERLLQDLEAEVRGHIRF